jgi:hypothetical protein
MASRQFLITSGWIAAAGTSFSALPLHGTATRGGRDICRRACERTALRGRRRCAAGGRQQDASASIIMLKQHAP